MSARVLIMIAAIALFTAVGAGAFGAHGLRHILSPELLAVWHTAVTYQMVHGLGLFAIALMMPRFGSALLQWAGMLMVTGIVIFSGSLYALALTGVGIIGAITPIGGVSFLLAWLLVFIAALRSGATGIGTGTGTGDD